ncbi:hypothetical protein [Corynebacterium anserum]|uniref:Uncharacterized protein n=1 Tax=Corynebacterium anserum TaxID=2684406 RepID=A0A7G7YQM0_9CORY|nr:hypothetical protein [Corynebacterium anserum]MBC2682485.1 hypothetical protein [Corynebacterium anserum]QNH96790.1 hypothetical protein GP473_09165 [Corynebacterium anserum]
MGFDTWGIILIFFLFTPIITVGSVSIWWYLNSRKHLDDPPMTQQDYYTMDMSQSAHAQQASQEQRWEKSSHPDDR